MARFKFGRPISLRWNGLLIEGPAETVFEIPDEYYEEFNEDVGGVEPTLVWLDADEGSTLRARVSALELASTSFAILDAKGDLISATADNTAARLGVGTDGQVLVANSATSTGLEWQENVSTATGKVKQYVKNASGGTINKGQAVYVSGADGTNVLVDLADYDTDATSSKTLGLMESTVANNGFGYVIMEGILTGFDTTAASAAGVPVWLGADGNLVYGTAPSEPSHTVYIGVVTRRNSNNGEVFIKVQNGYELTELHDVEAASPADNDIIQYNSTSGTWKNETLANAGIATSSHNHSGVYDPAGTAASAISTHEAASDPHPTYLTATEGNAAYAATGHSHSGLLPTGGTTGQVLSKVSGTNYDVTWSAAGGGASLSNTAAVALGTAAAGTASEASRQDHVHPTTDLATLTGTETLTNKTLSIPVIDNPRLGYSTTATSAGTLTLTNTSGYYQFFTGSTSGQIVQLPVASTMALGQSFLIVNTSSASITVQSSGGNTVQSISGGLAYLIVCILTSGTTSASWSSRFASATFTTGTGNTVLNSTPSISSPTLSGRTTIGGSLGTNQTSTTTSATPYTFTGSDLYQLRYTGTVAQTLTMQQFPVAGVRHEITNASSANITVNANGGGLIAVIRPNETWLFVCNTANTTVPSGWYAYILGGGSPIGSVQAYLGSNANIPSGWLLCNGAVVSRTTYAGLFGVIGTTFGAGDGSTTFGLPDLTGHMLVGASVTAPVQTGTGDSYLNATWDHNHIHSHSTNPAATASGSPSTQLTSISQTGSGQAGSNTHTHTTDIAATTSDTDSTAMSTSPTQKRTRVNYIIKT